MLNIISISILWQSDGVRSVTQSPRSMLFQSPEGSATKPQYRIDSVFTGPGIERHERVREELDGLDADNDGDGDRDTHTKPGGLFHDVYVDLIPKEEAETVCAFVSPTHSLDLDTLALATHSNRSRNGNKDGTGTAPILHPSAFLSPVRTSSAGDIDCELRARLQVRFSIFSFLLLLLHSLLSHCYYLDSSSSCVLLLAFFLFLMRTPPPYTLI